MHGRLQLPITAAVHMWTVAYLTRPALLIGTGKGCLKRGSTGAGSFCWLIPNLLYLQDTDCMVLVGRYQFDPSATQIRVCSKYKGSLTAQVDNAGECTMPLR